MLFRFVAVLALLVASTVAHAQGRIAVVNLEEAILQTDYAQQRLRDFEAGEAFAEDKAEFDNLKAELDKLVQDFQRDQAAMSDDDQVAARQKMASKNADLEYASNTSRPAPAILPLFRALIRAWLSITSPRAVFIKIACGCIILMRSSLIR